LNGFDQAIPDRDCYTAAAAGEIPAGIWICTLQKIILDNSISCDILGKKDKEDRKMNRSNGAQAVDQDQDQGKIEDKGGFKMVREQTDRVVCPECGKECAARGISSHIRLVHGKAGQEAAKMVDKAKPARKEKVQILHELIESLTQIRVDIAHAKQLLKETNIFDKNSRAGILELVKQLQQAESEIMEETKDISGEVIEEEHPSDKPRRMWWQL
jgi:hypothetical protein